jgi:hypothetical protein
MLPYYLFFSHETKHVVGIKQVTVIQNEITGETATDVKEQWFGVDNPSEANLANNESNNNNELDTMLVSYVPQWI